MVMGLLFSILLESYPDFGIRTFLFLLHAVIRCGVALPVLPKQRFIRLILSFVTYLFRSSSWKEGFHFLRNPGITLESQF
jgi:hypothetical protein